MSVSSRARWTRPIDGRGWKAAHKPGSVHRHRARGPGGGGDHLSGTAVTGGLERHWGYGTGKMANPCSAGRSPGLAPSRGLPSRHLSMPLVRSYRTLAPLPVQAGEPRPANRHRRCVSVALSSRSPAPGVTRQAWPSGSPDFPQPAGSLLGRNPATFHRSRSPRLLSKEQVTQPPAGPMKRQPWRSSEGGSPLAIGWAPWGCSSAG